MNDCSEGAGVSKLLRVLVFNFRRTILLALCVMQSITVAWAAGNQSVPLPPDIPPPIEDGEPMDQDVRIYREDKKTIYEYRVNGELYFIKVVPEIGPTYYLTDADGDGVVNDRTQGPEAGMKIHQWKLFSW